MTKKIKGILFDFDGVIAESEKIWFGTAILTLKKMGLNYVKDFCWRIITTSQK